MPSFKQAFFRPIMVRQIRRPGPTWPLIYYITGLYLFFTNKKQGALPCLLLICCFPVPSVEFFNTAASLAETLLAGKKRMGFAADIYIDQRIFIAVFPFHGLIGCSRRTSQEGIVRTDIAEYYWMIFRMNSLLQLSHLTSLKIIPRYYIKRQ